MELNENYSEKAKVDFKLIEKAIQFEDQKAFETLMKRYQKSVYYMLLKMINNPEDAEDLTIEAFAKAFRNLHRFNPEYAFSTWLFKIATNNCIDFIRKRKLQTMSIDSAYVNDDGESVAFDLKDSQPDPMEETIRNQKKEIIQNVVDELPPKYRKLIQLRYFQELSYEEIAVELEAPLGTVKAQLHRARELLYNMIKHSKDKI